MRVSDVRKKYPDFFTTVEDGVLFDCGNIRDVVIPVSYCRRIAYNAAAVATLELHKVLVAVRKNAAKGTHKKK